MDKKRAFIAFFWAAGMIYTGHNLIENCIRYKQYNSMTINKYDKNGDYNTYTRPSLTAFQQPLFQNFAYVLIRNIRWQKFKSCILILIRKSCKNYMVLLQVAKKKICGINLS